MIEIKNIHKKYKKTVLEDISFNVEKGQCIGIVGANGCGKSTLLSIMAGILQADDGEMLVQGKNILNKKRVLKNLVGFVPQYNPLIEELSVKDNLRLWFSQSGVSLKESAKNGIVKTLGINEYINKPVSKLSGGMKRRVSIAAALADNPPLLILDEPGTALDLVARGEIREYIKWYIKNGGTVVMTTHEESEMAICTRKLMMKNGRIEELPADITTDKLEKLL